MEEDPTIFQYDELYEDMDNKRKEEKTAQKKAQPQGPKYIKKLLETAEKRKKEYERRIERQVQKERDEEGEQFKDKESFVTSSYKKKLEEMRAAEEEEKKAEYLESVGDVQKQGNLDGFYRHLYAQKTGDAAGEPPSTAKMSVPDTKNADSVPKKERHYRKRDSAKEQIEEEEESVPVTDKETNEEAIKTHIASNLDADSDFSIDSSDSEDEKEKLPVDNPTELEEKKESVNSEPPKDETNPIPNMKPDNEMESEEEPEPEVVKIDIWAKRTVGNVFDEAVKRYYERKAARSA